MAGHEIKVEFQNVNNLKNEILEDQPFQYTIKVVDSSTQADVSSQYDIEDQTVGTPKLTTLFPDVSYRLEAREYTYEGAIDPSTKIITRNVTTVSGELPKTYDIKFTCYYDGSYTFSVTHNNQDVTAKVAPHIIVDNSILPVEKARQAYISVPNKQLTTTSTTVQTPYSSADISITNFPLASGDYIASASFLYNGSAYINIYDNGSGEMQIFTFEVTIADLSIVNAAGYPTNYDFNYSGATATLTIIYMPV